LIEGMRRVIGDEYCFIGSGIPEAAKKSSFGFQTERMISSQYFSESSSYSISKGQTTIIQLSTSSGSNSKSLMIYV